MPEQGAVPEPQSQGSQPQGGAVGNSEVADGVANDQAQLDLSSHPDFQKAMRSFNQKQDELRQQLEQERAARQSLQQRYEEQVIERLPENEREEWRIQQLMEERDQYAQQLEQIRMEQARRDAIQNVAQRAGLTLEQLADVEDPYALTLKLADEIARLRQGGQPSQQQAQPTPTPTQGQPHTPFIGPGQPRHQPDMNQQFGQLEQRARSGDYGAANEYIKMLIAPPGDGG